MISNIDLNEGAIFSDPQLHEHMERMGADLADAAQGYTRVTLLAAAGDAEMIDGVPHVPVGARAAGNVSAEIGTRNRPARRMFKRAADAAGLSLGDG